MITLLDPSQLPDVPVMHVIRELAPTPDVTQLLKEVIRAQANNFGLSGVDSDTQAAELRDMAVPKRIAARELAGAIPASDPPIPEVPDFLRRQAN